MTLDLNGKQVVFTGTLEIKRAEAKKLAEKAGATVKSGVSGTTDILVAGEKAGSKVAAAKAKGVAIWTEAQFVAACGGSATGPKKPIDKKAKAPAKKAPATKAPAITHATIHSTIISMRGGSFRQHDMLWNFLKRHRGTRAYRPPPYPLL